VRLASRSVLVGPSKEVRGSDGSARILQFSDIHYTARSDGEVLGVSPDALLAAVLSAWRGFGESTDLVLLRRVAGPGLEHLPAR
jgi:hypothetical protein